MKNRQQGKKLLEGYIGVKFNAVQRSKESSPETAEIYPRFKRTCERLKAYNMTPANAGNISLRHGGGFFITASGSNLGCLEENEVIFVEDCDAEAQRVIYHGPQKPSSESIMHWLIYYYHPEARGIVHAHDEFATRPELLAGEVGESHREEPYGTIELARMAIETFQKANRIIVLKNHGYVAIGSDLDQTCDLIVETHMRLLGKQESQNA